MGKRNLYKLGALMNLSIPERFLRDISRQFPDAWKDADRYRSYRGEDGFPVWDDAVFLPLAGWYAVTCDMYRISKLTVIHAMTMQKLFFAGAWRPRQDVIRFDPEVYQELIDTPFDGNLPSEVLWRLPAWAVYIETPGLTLYGIPHEGFMAALEEDAGDGTKEMRLMFFREEDETIKTVNIILYLGNWNIKEAIRRAKKKTDQQAWRNRLPMTEDEDWERIFDRGLEQAISLLLYVCSYGFTDKEQKEKPVYPQAKRVKKGWRIFPAFQPTVHVLGEKIGEQIRKAREYPNVARTHGSPRPHVRRAHWHGFWSGPLRPDADGERKFSLRWLPPISVAMRDDKDEGS